jgi:membrane protease YdiL (CAAX protease family)
VPSLGTAVALLLAVAALYVLGGFPLQLLLGEPGLLLSQLLFLGLPPVLFVLAFRYDARRTLSLALPTRRQVAAGLLLLAGATQIAWLLAWLQGLFVEVPVEYLEAMGEVLTAESPGRFLWLLVLVAAVPALAEETLFRGTLLAGFRTAMPPLVAVVATGLVFGLFHVAPQTGFRILPTAWLGMVLAWVVVASGSLPLAVLLHFVNNAALLALAAVPATRELATATEREPSLLLLPLALAFFASGVWLMRSATGRAAGTGPGSGRGPDGRVIR